MTDPYTVPLYSFLSSRHARANFDQSQAAKQVVDVMGIFVDDIYSIESFRIAYSQWRMLGIEEELLRLDTLAARMSEESGDSKEVAKTIRQTIVSFFSEDEKDRLFNMAALLIEVEKGEFLNRFVGDFSKEVKTK